MSAYLERVLAENSLSDVADFLVASGELCYYLDRHIDPPRSAESRDRVGAANEAGICLLLHWKQETKGLLRRGLWVSAPVLIIDDEWLAQAAEAPPPHVHVTLAKSLDAFSPPPFADSGGNDAAASPFRALLEQHAGSDRVVRVPANPNHPDDLLGCWLVF